MRSFETGAPRRGIEEDDSSISSLGYNPDPKKVREVLSNIGVEQADIEMLMPHYSRVGIYMCYARDNGWEGEQIRSWVETNADQLATGDTALFGRLLEDIDRSSNGSGNGH